MGALGGVRVGNDCSPPPPPLSERVTYKKNHFDEGGVWVLRISNMSECKQAMESVLAHVSSAGDGISLGRIPPRVLLSTQIRRVGCPLFKLPWRKVVWVWRRPDRLAGICLS